VKCTSPANASVTLPATAPAEAGRLDGLAECGTRWAVLAGAAAGVAAGAVVQAVASRASRLGSTMSSRRIATATAYEHGQAATRISAAHDDTAEVAWNSLCGWGPR